MVKVLEAEGVDIIRLCPQLYVTRDVYVLNVFVRSGLIVQNDDFREDIARWNSWTAPSSSYDRNE